MLRRALVKIGMRFELERQVKAVDDKQDDSCSPGYLDDCFIRKSLVAEGDMEDGLRRLAMGSNLFPYGGTHWHQQAQRRQYQQR